MDAVQQRCADLSDAFAHEFEEFEKLRDDTALQDFAACKAWLQKVAASDDELEDIESSTLGSALEMVRAPRLTQHAIAIHLTGSTH